MLASVPEFIDLTPEMKERLDRFQEDHKNDPLGGVGGRVTFEDEGGASQREACKRRVRDDSAGDAQGPSGAFCG